MAARPWPAALLLATLVAALPAAGDEAAPALSADAFEALTTGRTFYYTMGGTPYGTEQYLPGHKVVWAFTGDDCVRGVWYPRDEQICFVYEDGTTPEQCWTFHEAPEGLTAYSVGRGPGPQIPLVARRSSPEPMACMGPDVGV